MDTSTFGQNKGNQAFTKFEDSLTKDPFEELASRYDHWFEKHKYAFQSELNAIKQYVPADGLGVEIGLGTGRFSFELGIKDGVEPSAAMRAYANQRGIEVMDANAENLPYKDLRFDFALMVTISYFNDLKSAFSEAYRVLKKEGKLVVGLIDENSAIGKYYKERKPTNAFYKKAKFYTIEKVTELLKKAGFKKFEYSQTLFGNLDEMDQPEPFKEGYGEGSFVVICASK